MDGFTTKAIAQLFLANPPKEFQPCAYYDKHLDCIRVQTKDCSFTEIRLNKTFTIYRANYEKSGKYIGFSIKGIRHLFEDKQLPKAKEGPYILAEIIDAKVKADPEGFSDLILREFEEMLNFEVEDFEYAKAA